MELKALLSHWTELMASCTILQYKFISLPLRKFSTTKFLQIQTSSEI